MATVEMVMPKMGESIMEGTVLTWLKQVGEAISEEEAVLEVATDKVDTEVPSLHEGVLKEILAQEGDVIPVGQPIAIIELANGVASEPVEEAFVTSAEKATTIVEEAITNHSSSTNGSTGVSSTEARFYSPLVLNIAKEEGINQSELDGIPGSGKEGRVTKKDMLAYVAQREKGTVPT
ncbi:MAG: biotin/lipoyl-containing protein, partial [Bacteroidota bacterium]